ncbi:MAG: pyruvate, water dikinase regulatory protein [Actinomycetota bacterium]|nr:kinase/pyrophosphorylase [Coriobacteriia bacterium]MDP2233993.1 pyruvate, water dikinase regulatory protein [Actinomycetota bacterium]
MSEDTPISIHVISDSLGETADLVARAAEAQFEPDKFRIERLPKVTSPEQLHELVSSHCGRYCLFFYTLVNRELCAEMERLCEGGINGVDLLTPAVEMLSTATGYLPAGEAGAMRRTDQEYFDRIEAMEFAVKHDDGRNIEGFKDADIVLIGVSRSSKTPLAMYLAFKGWRVANLPLAPEMIPPPELFELDPRKVFGLVTNAEILHEIRTERMKELGGYVHGYAEREAIETDLEEARALMRRIGCLVVNTGGRAVEEAAQEIIRHVHGGLNTRD